MAKEEYTEEELKKMEDPEKDDKTNLLSAPRGMDVKKFQQEVVRLGHGKELGDYGKNGVDGQWGPKTAAAYRKYGADIPTNLFTTTNESGKAESPEDTGITQRKYKAIQQGVGKKKADDWISEYMKTKERVESMKKKPSIFDTSARTAKVMAVEDDVVKKMKEKEDSANPNLPWNKAKKEDKITHNFNFKPAEEEEREKQVDILFKDLLLQDDKKKQKSILEEMKRLSE